MARRALVSAPRSLHRSRQQILRWNTRRDNRQSRPWGRPRRHAGRRGSRRAIRSQASTHRFRRLPQTRKHCSRHNSERIRTFRSEGTPRRVHGTAPVTATCRKGRPRHTLVPSRRETAIPPPASKHRLVASSFRRKGCWNRGSEHGCDDARRVPTEPDAAVGRSSRVA
jgi:hypothetical protein